VSHTLPIAAALLLKLEKMDKPEKMAM